ncbi:MAG: protein nirH [Betaproteobacteria bacterium HGW-Betaproteobacteria-13]|jgi:DNA-binding Lrp family transcriptional regulator|uniref:siroheme decarboxylase n=1 Tax=Parazoarcus communis TaxID=41977 RepID=A0A2U8H6K6_9RHOO|nr:AsnC family transcriptional regulator [Parazoarcus communis]AWI81324.1 protein nirH [Parazoarcus communis]PKO52859.1 MAG: protein nirH [Betaproteobacteria bacterium HGW-Betaproteobacteria-21]PKO81205.1 MAG: protein nirH [Betaproteobacteria bacterium HGW-Betaproteobacteria-13]
MTNESVSGVDAGGDELDRRLVLATQQGLPLVPRPYAELASQLGCTEAVVRERLAAMLSSGAIRRIGAVPNHYAIGYTANGMTVWDIDDALVDEVGELVGALGFITHCYRRPRQLPDWPYNLFAMVHAGSREAALERVDEVAALIHTRFPCACRAHDVLFSTAILKKTGIRLS